MLVAAHMPHWVPPDALYLPVQVGAALAGADGRIPGFQPDDVGDNISADNPRYCELTALYWGCKNLPADEARYLGLVQYRRYFAGSGQRGTLTAEEASSLLRHAPVVLPKARNYRIETVESHYAHTMDPVHIECLRAAQAGVDFDGMTPFQERCMGRMGERLMDTWITVNAVPYVECPVCNVEPVNWARKGASFLAAKFAGRKYEESF